MMLQNLTKARQARDAIIKEICDGLPSYYTEEQALRRCQDKDLLTRLALINDRIRIVGGELVSCGHSYRLRSTRANAALGSTCAFFRRSVRCSCAGLEVGELEPGATNAWPSLRKLPLCVCGYLKIFLFGKTAWICLRRERGIVDEEKTPDTSDEDAY